MKNYSSETFTLEECKNIYKETLLNTKRDGIEQLLDYLEHKTDFFTAPASTKFHESREGGLLRHSLNVYTRLFNNVMGEWNNLPTEETAALGGDKCLSQIAATVAIVALLHDITKSNFYKLGSRNVKNEETGQWEKVPIYTVRPDDEILGYGHGEESVYIASSFIKLTREEAFSIRFHMGDFEDYNTGRAYNKYALATLLHVSDIEATYIDESNALLFQPVKAKE